MSHAIQVQELSSKISEFSSADGEFMTRKLEEKMVLLVLWLSFINSNYKTNNADELLEAASACIRECAAFLSLGMVRPAFFGFRIILDLCLAWLYFKYHSVEWERVNSTGDGFKMKKDVMDYLSNHVDGFSGRNGVLQQTKKRKVEDVYRLLSAHIHGQSTPVLPSIDRLSDVVKSRAVCFETLDLAYATSEYMSDVFISVFAKSWHALPDLIKQHVDERFVTVAQRAKFFEKV